MAKRRTDNTIVVCPSFGHCVVCPSFGHCVVCPSSDYSFGIFKHFLENVIRVKKSCYYNMSCFMLILTWGGIKSVDILYRAITRHIRIVH
jgi:hypothetical protein